MSVSVHSFYGEGDGFRALLGQALKSDYDVAQEQLNGTRLTDSELRQIVSRFPELGPRAIAHPGASADTAEWIRRECLGPTRPGRA